MCELVCLTARETERERVREREGGDTSAGDLGLGDFTFCQESETRKEKEGK